MIRILALTVFFAVVVADSEVFEKNSEPSEIQESSNFAVVVNNQDNQEISSDLAQEGQSPDVIVRAKRYYGCGCGCGCATVAAVSAAPCGYGCCGCGYGK